MTEKKLRIGFIPLCDATALLVAVDKGFAAAEGLYDEHGAVKGVAIGDMGIGRDGAPGPRRCRRWNRPWRR